MADDHENFSNVSWSEHVHDQTSRLPPAEEPGHTMEGPSTGIEGEPPLGGDRLECTVGTPLKENNGSKDAFVSYLITTHVCAALRNSPRPLPRSLSPSRAAA